MQPVINQVTLIGNLGNDPTFFGEEHPGASFNLATNEFFGRGEDRRQRTDWHKVVCWKALLNTCKHLGKGDRIALVGSLRTRTWDDNGTPRRIVEVHAWGIEFLNVKATQPKSDAVPE